MLSLNNVLIHCVADKVIKLSWYHIQQNLEWYFKMLMIAFCNVYLPTLIGPQAYNWYQSLFKSRLLLSPFIWKDNVIGRNIWWFSVVEAYDMNMDTDTFCVLLWSKKWKEIFTVIPLRTIKILQFCTCHDDTAVVSCATFDCENAIRIWKKGTQFTPNLVTIEKSEMIWADTYSTNALRLVVMIKFV